MKIGLLSDIHGNITALEAVLCDCRQQGVEAYFVIGDVIGKGPSPERCVAAIEKLQPLAWVVGNCDQCAAILDKPYEVHPKFDCTVMFTLYDQQYLSAEQLERLLALPLKEQVKIHNYLIDVFHAMPDQAGTQKVFVTQTQANFNAMLEKSAADMAIYGHVHCQILRVTEDHRPIVNPGSIGLPFNFGKRLDVRAKYAILDIDEQGMKDITFRAVEYDISKEIAIAIERNLPYRNMYIEAIQTGKSVMGVEDYDQYNKKHGYSEQVRKIYGVE